MKFNGSRLKTASIIANVLLVILLVASFVRMLKLRNMRREYRTEIRELRSTRREYETFIANSIGENRYIGGQFPKFSGKDVEGRKFSTDFTSRKAAIIFLYEWGTCQPCLITQLKVLQYIHSNLEDPDTISIYAFTNESPAMAKRRTRTFGLEYSVVSLEDKSLLENPLGERTPVVFVVDSNNTIIRCHTPVIDKPHFSILFYNEIQPHLELTKSLFKLTGTLLVDVVRNEFDSSELQHLLF